MTTVFQVLRLSPPPDDWSVDIISPDMASLKEAADYVANSPDLDKTCLFIGEYLRDKDGFAQHTGNDYEVDTTNRIPPHHSWGDLYQHLTRK